MSITSLTPQEVAQAAMLRIQAWCEAERLFLGTVRARGVIRNIIADVVEQERANPHLPSGAAACAADTADGVSPPSPSSDQSRADAGADITMKHEGIQA